MKGKLRTEAYAAPAFVEKHEVYRQAAEEKIAENVNNREEALKQAQRTARRKAAVELGIESVFGPEWDNAEEHAGAISPGDAKILLFPVRSGPFCA